MTTCKGIILAAGSGSRLYPVTLAVSKQLLPVFDKPMVYYPLSLLMLAGIRDVLIIHSPSEQGRFQSLFGDGSRLGMRFRYAAQPKADGIAQAYVIGRDFVGDEPSCLVLGDNILHGYGLSDMLARAASRSRGATVFGYWVRDPERYGVAEFDADGRVTDIVEKPAQPRSNLAVVGLYFYDGRAPEFAASLRPSARGELEITDLNRCYLADGSLQIEQLGRGYAWLDAGTHESLLQASEFVESLEARQGLRICCPEEIAWRNGWITADELAAAAAPMAGNSYGRYLLDLLQQDLGPWRGVRRPT